MILIGENLNIMSQTLGPALRNKEAAPIQQMAKSETAVDYIDLNIGPARKGGDELMPVFLSEERIARDGETIEAYRSDLFKRRYLSEVRPFPGVRPLFEHIRAAGLTIALASSGKRSEVEHYTEILAKEVSSKNSR